MKVRSLMWITMALIAVAIVLTTTFNRITYSAKYEALGTRLWAAIEQFAKNNGNPPPNLEALFTANVLNTSDINLVKQSTTEMVEILKYQYNPDSREASLRLVYRGNESNSIVWRKQF